MRHKYRKGDRLRGKVDGREIEIKKAGNVTYEYIDLKTGRIFVTDYKTLERCVKEKEDEQS